MTRLLDPFLLLVLALLSAAPLVSQAPNLTPTRSCESLAAVKLPNTTIASAATHLAAGRVPATCRVTAIVTHPPAGDEVKVFIWLPIDNWNGRFQGRGGGGFSGGSERSLAEPVAEGYVAGATDTGHTGGSGSFALDENNRHNWMLIRDNAYLGIHDMTVTGKALTKEFYDVDSRYSYFNGCSTGGRQGLAEAQRYPADYDGILSGCPAINWPELHNEQLWGPLVMREANNYVPQCKFEAARQASIEACDQLDGVRDQVIEDPRQCSYDPEALVGQSIDGCGTITTTDAGVIRKIWQGPRRQDGSFLWYGLPYGGDFSGLSNTGGDPLTAKPFPITIDWFRYFLTQNPDWDWTTITHGAYEQFWDQGLEQFGPVLGTSNPDLSAFRDHGGKLLLWHGAIDRLIYPVGSINYYERVLAQMGGVENTRGFLRFFLAPGVAHCRGGNGPQPEGHFEALVRWVEEGEAPDTLDAVIRDKSGQPTRTRPLCPYPLVAKYKGNGSTDDAFNFECAAAPLGLEQTDLYRSGQDGYHTYRIPSLIVTKAGTLLAFAEGRKDARGDSGDIDLLVKRSEDGGQTWSVQHTVWNEGVNTAGNPCPAVDQRTGRILLLATWNRSDDHGRDLHDGQGKDTRRVYLLDSTDDGRNWSAPREITASAKAPDWWWYATGPGIGIQLQQGSHAGRLVIPANHSSSANGFGAHTIYSDDGGQNWSRSNAIKPACNESQVVELADGRLMMNMRSQSFTNQERTGYRAISFSTDGGATWSAPEFDPNLGDPAVQASLIRYGPAAGASPNILLFSNPSPPISPQRGERVRMTVRLSTDEGKTWPVSRLIHPGPSAYSSLARLPDDSIALLYEGGEGNQYNRLIFARFSLNWLTNSW